MKSQQLRHILAIIFIAAAPWFGTLLAPSSPINAWGSANAAPPPAREGWYRNIVGLDFVKDYATIPPRKDVAIIDARSERRYDAGHIPGATHIPGDHFEQYQHLLPENKNQLLIFYCNGIECPLSHNSARKAEALGYRNIQVFAGGEPVWKEGGQLFSVTAAYLKKILEAKEPLALIDVRNERDFARGAIPGAINIPAAEFDRQTTKLPDDWTMPLIFYCSGLDCPDSAQVAKKARDQGYNNVRIFAEGLPAWRMKYPDEIAVTADTASLRDQDPGALKAAEFNKMYQEARNSFLLIDVREPREYSAATIKGARNMPLSELTRQIDSLPLDKPVVFFCGTGGRASEVYDTVRLIMPEIQSRYLNAEVQFFPDGSYRITKAH